MGSYLLRIAKEFEASRVLLNPVHSSIEVCDFAVWGKYICPQDVCDTTLGAIRKDTTAS